MPTDAARAERGRQVAHLLQRSAELAEESQLLRLRIELASERLRTVLLLQSPRRAVRTRSRNAVV